jgi:hypothetical protein
MFEKKSRKIFSLVMIAIFVLSTIAVFDATTQPAKALGDAQYHTDAMYSSSTGMVGALGQFYVRQADWDNGGDWYQNEYWVQMCLSETASPYGSGNDYIEFGIDVYQDQWWDYNAYVFLAYRDTGMSETQVYIAGSTYIGIGYVPTDNYQLLVYRDGATWYLYMNESYTGLSHTFVNNNVWTGYDILSQCESYYQPYLDTEATEGKWVCSVINMQARYYPSMDWAPFDFDYAYYGDVENNGYGTTMMVTDYSNGWSAMNVRGLAVVTISSNFANAPIYVDDIYVGETTYIIRLNPGYHTISGDTYYNGAGYVETFVDNVNVCDGSAYTYYNFGVGDHYLNFIYYYERGQ